MTRFALQRMMQGALSLVGILILVFILARLTGSPARHYLPATATEAMVDEFNSKNGYDRPIYEQFYAFVVDVLHFDFGDSLLFRQPAVEVVLDRYPATLKLAFLTILVAVVAGVVIGVLAARRPDSVFDRIAGVLSLTALSVPQFWIGIMGITVFAVHLGVLPTSGMGDSWKYWILPLITLAVNPTGILVQVVRSSMVDALRSDYIKVARGKGVPERSILFKHALRNAAIPALTVAGVLAANVVNGAIVVETVFGWPGVGSLMVDSIKRRDFALIQAVTVVTAFAIILLNFFVDLCYKWLNPRIDYEA